MTSYREEVFRQVRVAREELVASGIVSDPKQMAVMVNNILARVGPIHGEGRDDTGNLVQAIALMIGMTESAMLNGDKLKW